MRTIKMDETIREWLINMYQEYLNDALATRSNEHIWELGYDGPDPNPHTENIRKIDEYISILEDKLNELN